MSWITTQTFYYLLMLFYENFKVLYDANGSHGPRILIFILM